ncbi:MAG: Fic family protein [Butyrivibrio sp.]|nr:Fic family protein [Butyrivibrio sp.]MBR1640954.1 Fic family protein [Butyrivibrio sp.]
MTQNKEAYEKGARLGFGLIKNHCMEDGNKRIGTPAKFINRNINGSR